MFAAGKNSLVSAVKLSLALADESLLLSALCYAAIAQLDRAPDYESGGLGFDSLWPHQIRPLGYSEPPTVNVWEV